MKDESQLNLRERSQSVIHYSDQIGRLSWYCECSTKLAKEAYEIPGFKHMQEAAKWIRGQQAGGRQ